MGGWAKVIKFAVGHIQNNEAAKRESAIKVNTGPLISSTESSVNGKRKKGGTILNVGSSVANVNKPKAWKLGV